MAHKTISVPVPECCLFADLLSVLLDMEMLLWDKLPQRRLQAFPAESGVLFIYIYV